MRCSFMERKGIGRTPKVVAVSPERRFALLTWIDGEAVDAVTDGDVAEFAAFQIALDQGIDADARSAIGEASEACLSGPRIMSQIERRYARLAAVKHDVPEFAAFFDEVLVPSLRRFEAGAQEAYRRLGFDFAEDIAPQFRTLIPSDMGAHNALAGRRRPPAFPRFRVFRLGRSAHQHRQLHHASRHAAERPAEGALPAGPARPFRPACRDRPPAGADAALRPALVRHHPGRASAGALAAPPRQQCRAGHLGRGPPRADRQGAGAGVADGDLVSAPLPR